MTWAPDGRRATRLRPTLRPALRRGLALAPLCLILVAALVAAPSTGGSPLPQATSSSSPQGTSSPTPQATAGEAQVFPQTGFRLGAPSSDPFGEYFAARGGVSTFGYPVSRPFTLEGQRVQFFQRYVMQQLPTGVGLLNILDESYMPYTDFGTAMIPPVDPQLAASAPPPGTPSYGQAAATFVEGAVPNTWQGQPVGFLDAFRQVGALSGAADPAQQTLVAIEVLGFPTSAPAPDPRDRNFVYQRFQRSVLQYNALNGLTQPLLMADYLKSIITGRDLPLVLAMQAQRSRLYLQYQPNQPSWVARPADLPATDLTMAFEPDVPPIGGGTGAGTPPLGSLPPPLSGSSVPPQPFSSPGSPGLQPTSSLLPVPPTLVPSSQAGASPAVQGTPPTPATVQPTRNPATPVIERTEPGGAAVGQDIVIRGRNFGDQAGQVLFTGKLATSQVWADDFIVVTVPQGAADGTVRIRRPDGVLSNAVGFAPEMTATPGTTPSATVSPTPSFTPSPSPTPARPAVAAVEPYFGGVGSSVLIRGTGFGATTGNVLLGSQAAPVQLWSDTSVLVNIPNGADTQTQRIMRLRVVRTDGAVGEPPLCFIVSPGTPTPGPAPTGTPPAPTAVPPQPSAC